MRTPDRWIVVGGGASGMAAAFFLKQIGLDAVVVERDARIGGRMGTVRLGGRTLDCGGKNIGRRYRLFRQFASSLGTHPFEYFGLNSSQAVNGRVTTLDANARWRTMTDLVRGIAARDLIRFGRLLWKVKGDDGIGYLGSPFSRTLGDRYDGQPASHYFSQEFCRRILRPLSVRMNGAEPDEVYMGNLPSNVRMLLDTYEQFAQGLAPLLDAFRARYEVRLEAVARGLLVTGDRVTGVQVEYTDGRTDDLHAAGVIVATPAHAAAALTAPVLPGLASRLRSIAYYPVALVMAEYDRPIFAAGVRAFVFDDGELLSNAGAYGVNDLNVVRYTFSGKAFRRHASGAIDAEALLRGGEDALARYVPVARGSRRHFVARHFSPGLCAYAPRHGTLMDEVSREASRLRGLYLTGDYVQGASIEACFRAASACVRQASTECGLRSN